MRDDRVDALKFFAISLVVISHVANLAQYDGVIGQVVYVIRAINMPLFMFLSGWVLFGREGSSVCHFLRRKAAALLIPYFAWIAIRLTIAGTSPADMWSSMAAAAINPHVSGRPWFLYVLFEFYVMFALIRLATKRDAWLVVASLATIGITLLPDGDLFGRNNVQWLFTFFAAGYLAAKHRGRLPQAGLKLAGISLFAFGFLLLIGHLPDKGEGWPPWFFRYLLGLFSTAWWTAKPIFLAWKYLTAFSGIVAAWTIYSLLGRKWIGWQAFAGRRSLGMYLTQHLFLGLAFGTTAGHVAASSVAVLSLSLLATLLLESWNPARVLLLGAKTKKELPNEPDREPMAA